MTLNNLQWLIYHKTQPTNNRYVLIVSSGLNQYFSLVEDVMNYEKVLIKIISHEGILGNQEVMSKFAYYHQGFIDKGRITPYAVRFD